MDTQTRGDIESLRFLGIGAFFHHLTVLIYHLYFQKKRSVILDM